MHSNHSRPSLFNTEIRYNPSFAAPAALSSSNFSPLSSLAELNWSDPDLLLQEIDRILKTHRGMDLDWRRPLKVQKRLRQFQMRAAKDKGRFRHPSCRAAHAILTMGGCSYSNSMSCCGTFDPNANQYAKSKRKRPETKPSKKYCSRRRFCASCAWWAGRQMLSKFLATFTANQPNIHAFTLSWKFPDGNAGLPVPKGSPDEQGLVNLITDVWDIGKETFRALARTPDIVEGSLMVESLTLTGLMPLQVNPHFHGAILCNPAYLRDVGQCLEEGLTRVPAFALLSALGIQPSVRFQPLPTVFDFLRFMSYAYAPFGLGRPGSCIDDVYANAWDRCPNASSRAELNREVRLYVRAYQFSCLDRRRAVQTGRFWHRHESTLRCAPTEGNKKHIDDLYDAFEEAEIAEKLSRNDG